MLKKIIFYIKLLTKQRTYKSGEHKVKYVFEKGSNDNNLVVVFSGFPKKNQTARYNYMRTLEAINSNKLFILDDIGPNKRGAYYLGKNKNFSFANAVEKLIAKLNDELSPEKVIFCGSSKGGYSALYFGLRMNAKVVISGAQQYYIGNYLYQNDHRPIYNYITGSNDETDIEFMNNILTNEITMQENKPIIHLHYSKNEHTYSEHIKDLIEDLEKNNYSVFKDEGTYHTHSEVARYFPHYLIKTISYYLGLN